MNKYIALLRAVNFGGTGKLSMTDLKTMCREAGFDNVKTYIASGNVVFDAAVSSANVKCELEARLQAFLGKPIGVFVRTASEMKDILTANPFPNQPPNLTVAIFLDESPPLDALENVVGKVDEDIRLGAREIYVYYRAGFGRSKLKIPAAKHGAARNMNTIAKLVTML